MHSLYRAPDFEQEPFASAPDARFEAAPADGVFPEGFFATTTLPTYVKVGVTWRLARNPRMDAAVVALPDGTLRVIESRHVRAGQAIVVGYTEDASDGIYVHAAAFDSAMGEIERSRSRRPHMSRDQPADYKRMAQLLHLERARAGHIVWVCGRNVLHANGRDDLAWFVNNGFVSALLAGNGLAVHDIEQALMGTTFGMDHAGNPVPGGHALHMRAINQITRAGSIRAAVEQGILTDGIMFACVRHDVPFVLAGSIRDDGPLPDTITDTGRAHDMMREHACRTNMAVMVATALHAAAFDNMLPFCTDEPDGALRPIATIAVDASASVVATLARSGWQFAIGVVTDAPDFLHVLRHFVERQAEADAAAPSHDAFAASAHT